MDAAETKNALKLLAARLETLSAVLDKAEEWAAEADVALDELAAARLAGDMHPLAWQVAATCTQPLQFVVWSRGADLPNEVQPVVDWAEARAVLADTIALLATEVAAVTPEAKRIVLERMGVYLELPAQRYLDDWILPNLYFHLTTAYAILRMKGVPLGKADFMRHIGGDIRPLAPEPAS
ncbi:MULTISPECIES: DUF1993 domain-containing protein [Novosphingobium]|jgi:hypothetical protein|uniref:DUF1993 domain-containing protein n=1 Tax=Novosphingobium TaxID=165696 RepID=UPI0022F261FE|nr:DUF1993 domain-containing protein [Novosphingobium resinovorum]GLK43150.1 hypothetical protein GCM10017612_10690 [Novosphingobium resinovorum]